MYLIDCFGNDEKPGSDVHKEPTVTDYEYLKVEKLSSEEIVKRLSEECPLKPLDYNRAFDFQLIINPDTDSSRYLLELSRIQPLGEWSDYFYGRLSAKLYISLGRELHPFPGYNYGDPDPKHYRISYRVSFSVPSIDDAGLYFFTSTSDKEEAFQTFWRVYQLVKIWDKKLYGLLPFRIKDPNSLYHLNALVYQCGLFDNSN